MQTLPPVCATPQALQAILLESLTEFSGDQAARLLNDWQVWARDEQLAPRNGADTPWRTWAFIGGRGAGKTRAGAEWVRACARGLHGPAGEITSGTPEPADVRSPIALIGETYDAARTVMVEGVSGLLSVTARDAERPKFSPSLRKLTWPNGAVAQLFSAEDPDALRGPQFAIAWSDELCKWRYDQETWDMLQFALRLGSAPQQLITTTPRPTPLLKRLLADAQTVVTHAATSANAANLAPGFLRQLEDRYGQSALGRQELSGELVEDDAGALWSRDQLDALRVLETPPLERTVLAVDPPVSHSKSADACGLIVASIDAAGDVYVRGDHTVQGVHPEQWARQGVELFYRYQCDSVIVEVNQGGELVTSLFRQFDDNIPLRPVRATQGKWARAEPVAAFYARGRVRHCGLLAELEDEMCLMRPNGRVSGRSPDRVDALVWAVTDLAGLDEPAPRVRSI
ncbi:MAG: terminase family protein [Pseudomonadota bacterium]